MPSICLYFQVHQPNRLKPYTFFDIGNDHFYENDWMNGDVVNRVAEKCYLPANKLMLKLINEFPGKFKVCFSLSGTVIEQFENHRPDVLESFAALAATGDVEFLGETYYHSLSFFYSEAEFKRQVKLHRDKIWQHFRQKPRVFRNTELTYNNDLAAMLDSMGYKGVVAEGVDKYLEERSPNHIYHSAAAHSIGVLLRNHKLSDDIGFRFSDRNWEEYPLYPQKFSQWIAQSGGELINIFMDYESIGEHQWADTGIFDFFEKLPGEVLGHKDMAFVTPSEAIVKYKAKGIYDVEEVTSWADQERNLSAWNGNNMQKEALKKIFALEKLVKRSRNKDLIHVWAKLQTSDHFYYMSTKGHTDGMVHDYFSPYSSPYDGYIYFMNTLSDLEIMLNQRNRKKTSLHLE